MKSTIKISTVMFLLLFMSVSSASAQNYSNQPIHWGIKRASDGKPAQAGKVWDDLLAKHGAFYKGDPDKKDALFNL